LLNVKTADAMKNIEIKNGLHSQSNNNDHMTRNIHLLLAFLLLTITYGFTQTIKSTSDTTKTKSSLTLEMIYSSNTLNSGRSDPGYKNYFNPAITYLNKSGLYVFANTSYYPSVVAPKFTDFSIEGGYQYSFGSNFSGDFSISYMHSNSNSKRVNAGAGTTFGTNLNYDFDCFTAGTGISYSKGKYSDFSLTPTISKSFEFSMGKDDQFDISIEPTLTVDIGSQNFYRDYLTKRKYKNTTVIAMINEHTKEMKKVQILAYEFAIPFSITLNKLSLNVTPYYILPENQPDFSDIILLLPGYKPTGNTFYYEFGISYLF
jgi:hypothetical protein